MTPDDTEDFIELLRQRDEYVQLRSQFAEVARGLRELLPGLSRSQRKATYDLICVIEENLPVFSLRHFEAAVIRIQKCCAACAAITVHHDWPDALKNYAGMIVGAADKWQAFANALVENATMDHKDWRHATQPNSWLRNVTRTIENSNFSDVPLSGESADDRAHDRIFIPTEDAQEVSDKALAEPRYAGRSIAELEAAAQGDPDLAKYLNARIRHPAWGHEQIWRDIGWNSSHGKAVDKRYRRLRAKLREQGGGIPVRDYVQPPGVSDASVTTYREPLFEGSRGAGISVWQHRDPYRDENK
jgi:hypothetical protein